MSYPESKEKSPPRLLNLVVGDYVINERYFPKDVKKITRIYSTKEGQKPTGCIYETEDGFLWDVDGRIKSVAIDARQRGEVIRRATDVEVQTGLFRAKRELIKKKLDVYHFLDLGDLNFIDEYLKRKMKDFSGTDLSEPG